MSSSSCGCNWGGVLAKAALIALVAGAIGLTDVSRVRWRKIDLSASAAGTFEPDRATAPQGDPPRPEASTTGATRPADTAAPADSSMISLEKAKELFQRMMTAGDVHFVDARNEDEFAKGRILGAVSLPPTKFGGAIPPEVDQLSRSATIVIYCGGGDCDASKLTGLRLQELGFGSILIFHDGFPAWENAGQPVEK